MVGLTGMLAQVGAGGSTTFDAVMRELVSFPTVMFVLGAVIAVPAILIGCIKEWLIARERERSRREIAAYVAEGTIDPDRAVALLSAPKRPKSGAGI